MIEEKIEDLLTWLEFELRSAERHPVLVISTFVLGVLAASPFDGYNARVTRLLTFHLLRRAGYAHIPYASLESRMEDLRDDYNDSFARSSTRFWGGDADLEPWNRFFLAVLDGQRERVENKIALEREVTDYPPLQRSIIEMVREHGNVGAGMLLKATGANRNTLKDNLRRLVDRGVLEKTGERRGTLYRLATVDRSKPA